MSKLERARLASGSGMVAGKRRRTADTRDTTRARMAEARDSMCEGRWCEAATLLERVILDCRTLKVGHAEALWALAICLFALDHEVGALLALQASLELDPTAVAAYELRDALLARFYERTAELGGAAKERRLASLLTSRLRAAL